MTNDRFERVATVSIVAASLAGARASLRMFKKSVDDANGALEEPSVVQLPAAKLFFGIPNSALGIGFYGLTIASQIAPSPAARRVARTFAEPATFLAGATSLYLARSLIRQRLSCVNCWTAHAVNLALVVLFLAKRRFESHDHEEANGSG